MEIEITHIEKGMVLMNPMTSLSALSANMGAFGIIATILAIIATVAAFILVVPESKRESWPLRQVPPRRREL